MVNEWDTCLGFNGIVPCFRRCVSVGLADWVICRSVVKEVGVQQSYGRDDFLF